MYCQYGFEIQKPKFQKNFGNFMFKRHLRQTTFDIYKKNIDMCITLFSSTIFTIKVKDVTTICNPSQASLSFIFCISKLDVIDFLKIYCIFVHFTICRGSLTPYRGGDVNILGRIFIIHHYFFVDVHFIRYTKC